MNKTESSDSNQKKESPEKRELENLPSSEQGKHKTKPRISTQKAKHTKQKNRRKFSCSEKVILALIGAVTTVITGLLVSPIVTCWVQPHTCEPPPVTPTFILALTPTTTVPTISISNDVRDISGNPIARNSAPFEIKVSGTVSNADRLYVYLIVANPYEHYVQPGLGQNVNGAFSVSGYLGEKDKPDGLQYTIYAVVTDKPYANQASFKDEGYIAKSREIMLTRESSLAPAPAP